MAGSPLALVGWVTGDSVMKSVRPVVSTRLNAPGDIEENMVSKISKLLSSPPCEEIELSRHALNNGSFMSNKFVELGVKLESGALEVDEGMVALNPFERVLSRV